MYFFFALVVSQWRHSLQSLCVVRALHSCKKCRSAIDHTIVVVVVAVGDYCFFAICLRIYMYVATICSSSTRRSACFEMKGGQIMKLRLGKGYLFQTIRLLLPELELKTYVVNLRVANETAGRASLE